MKLSKLFLIPLVGMLLMVPQLKADVVVDDNFNRPDGSLAGTVPTPGPGGVWTGFSGTAGDLLISSGQAVVQHGVPSEDAGTGFGRLVTLGTITANLDITVMDDTQISGSDSEYFCMFTDGGTFNFYSRLDISPGQSGGDYTFGIATTSSTAEALFPSDFTFGQTVSGTLTYDFGTGLSTFSVGATTISSTTSVVAAGINTFALRQSDSTNNETVFVDNLRVSSVPEPGSFAILGLVGLTGLARRRRK